MLTNSCDRSKPGAQVWEDCLIIELTGKHRAHFLRTKNYTNEKLTGKFVLWSINPVLERANQLQRLANSF